MQIPIRNIVAGYVLSALTVTGAWGQSSVLDLLAAPALVSEKPASITTSTDKATSPSSTQGEHIFAPMEWGADNRYKLQIGGDVRIRAENRDNFDLRDERNHHDDTLGFMRTRLNFDLTVGAIARAFVEIMDGREIGARREQGQEDPWDLHQAYIDICQPRKGPWTLRLGRQELDLGRDTRLVEATNWNNLRRTFVGPRALYRSEDFDVDLFVVHPDYFDRRRGDEEITDHARMRSEEWFYGMYSTLRQFKPHTLEVYFLGLSDRNSHRTFAPNRTSEDGTYGSSDRYTIGSVLYGPLHEDDWGKLTYTAEGALQWGRWSKDKIRAHMLRGDVTYEWKRPWKPSLGLVGTWASGDKDPDDGVNGRFDNLYGSNHGPYGIMDFVRPRNLRELALVGRLQPTEKLTLQAEGHAFWADSKTDTGLQAPGEKPLRDQDGRSGRELGQEISLVAQYKLSKRVNLEAGAAHFFPGGYPAAFERNDGANLFYVQTQIKF